MILQEIHLSVYKLLVKTDSKQKKKAKDHILKINKLFRFTGG